MRVLLNEPVHVLVIDRADPARDLVCRHVAELGFRCEAVATADDARTVLDWWRPVVIILEPDLGDGRAGLSRVLRTWAEDRFRPLLVILHSATARPSEDYDVFLEKPASLPQLDAAISTFLAS